MSDEAEPVYQRLLGLWIKWVGETHPMVAVTLDKIAAFYATQKKWDQAREATTKANTIRAYLAADGLSGEGSQLIEQGKAAEAIPVYRRALAVLEVASPEVEDVGLSKAVNELRASVEGMLKELELDLRKNGAQGRGKK